MSTSQRPINDHEMGLLRRLLEGEFAGVAQLREQLPSVQQVEVLDAEGSIRFRDVDGPLAQVLHRVPVEGQYKDADGMHLRALLHVVDGRLFELEFYKDDSTQIKRPPQTEDWEVLWL